MNLAAGTRLGPYEILSPLGAGGMGEVYRARDTRLGRDVAVKVLPQHLSANPEVRARFEREAKTVSSLNHPHICTLFDVGREGDTDYLVMELIEGETLAAKLQRGALPVGEVMKLGGEIADALDRAHRAGVVHRDLKPGNVMLTRSGAKLMDFGLARAAGIGGASGSATIGALTQSPTVAQPLTAEGTIVGTFQYMSPEQLEGREADSRSDLWALGCVLYEMSTGKRAFDGKSQASLITSIMGSQPVPISQAAPMTPPALDRLVNACLVKDPADRIQSAHDVKLQLAWIAEGGSQAGLPKPVAKMRRSRERLAWVVAGVAVVAVAVLAYVATRPVPMVPAVQAVIQPPKGVLYSSSTDRPMPLAISPDGTTIAFCARDGEGPDLLWVRSLGADDARPLPGTEGAEGPFFSPDGKSLGFQADGRLKRIDVAGGPVIELVTGTDYRGGTWGKNGEIVFSPAAYGPLSMVAERGGPATIITAMDTTKSEATHRYPHFLPDGRHILYLARRAGAGKGEKPFIYATEIGSSERVPVVEVASNVQYASGHILYVQGRMLIAQPFDVSALKVTGPPVPLVDDVRMDERFSRAVFAVSANGVLVCMTGADQTRTQLRWLDRTGSRIADVGEPADYTYGGTPAISPDGKSALLAIANRERGVSDVWIIDLESGRRRKLTVDGADHPHGIWLPDGQSVAVTTTMANRGGIDVLSVNGLAAHRVVSGPSFSWPLTAFGDDILYAPENTGSRFIGDIFRASLSGQGEASSLATTKADEYLAQFSPDGQYVAYTSDETGRIEVFVTAYPAGGRWQVSQAGGTQPRWNRDGRELLYVDPQNFLVSVDVEAAGGTFQTGETKQLFQFHGASGLWRYDISPDGTRFLVTAPLEEDLASPVLVITDWTRKLGSR